MSDADYEAWVEGHCQATAANAEATASLLADATRRAFAEWHATAGELGECTYRLVAGGRVPKFAADHAEAVARELMAYRTEQAQQARPDPAGVSIGSAPPRARCRWCGDTGLVVVPLWRCVEVPRDAPPRLVCYPGYRVVLTGSVLCDDFDCTQGARVRERDGRSDKPRPTLKKYLQRFQGTNVVRLLEEHEAKLVIKARNAAGPDRDGWAAMINAIRNRVAQTEAA